MPIYMIMPRYSHNYALFYQLLDSNLFTHRNTYAILREATSETYGPRSILHHISLSSACQFLSPFSLQSLLFNLHNKNTKNIYLIISIRSHFCKWPWRDWQPLYRVGCKVLICLCRYEVTHAWSPTGLITWFSKTKGNTCATLLHHPFLFKGKPTHAQEVARTISGAVAGESTHKSLVPTQNDSNSQPTLRGWQALHGHLREWDVIDMIR